MPTKHTWEAMPWEKLNPQLARRLVSGEKLMVAQVQLKAGCVVPRHAHPHEQFSYVLSGALRFWLGATVDSANEADSVLLRAGEILPIPGGVPHRVVALEDTLTLDLFSPPREDWLDGSDAYLRQR